MLIFRWRLPDGAQCPRSQQGSDPSARRAARRRRQPLQHSLRLPPGDAQRGGVLRADEDRGAANAQGQHPAGGIAARRWCTPRGRGQLALYRGLESTGEAVVVTTAGQLRELARQWEQRAGDSRLPVGFLLGMEGADPILTPEQVGGVVGRRGARGQPDALRPQPLCPRYRHWDRGRAAAPPDRSCCGRWRPAACCSTRRTSPTAVSGKHSIITPARSWRAIRTAAPWPRESVSSATSRSER